METITLSGLIRLVEEGQTPHIIVDDTEYEYEELCLRLERLNIFINKVALNKEEISDEEYDLLSKQVNIMSNYKAILYERLYLILEEE